MRQEPDDREALEDRGTRVTASGYSRGAEESHDFLVEPIGVTGPDFGFSKRVDRRSHAVYRAVQCKRAERKVMVLYIRRRNPDENKVQTAGDKRDNLVYSCSSVVINIGVVINSGKFSFEGFSFFDSMIVTGVLDSGNSILNVNLQAMFGGHH